MRLVGLHTRNTAVLNDGVGIVLTGVHEPSSRTPVMVLSPVSQLGRTWLLKGSNLRSGNESELVEHLSSAAMTLAVRTKLVAEAIAKPRNLTLERMAAGKTSREWRRSPRLAGSAWEMLSDNWRQWPLLPATPTTAPAALIVGALLSPRNGLSERGTWRSPHFVQQHAERYVFDNATVKQHVDAFLQSEAARRLIRSAQLVVRIVHDAADMPAHAVYRGVQLHSLSSPIRVALDPHVDLQRSAASVGHGREVEDRADTPAGDGSGQPLPAQDARWEAMQRVLREHPPEWGACAFAIDVYDVRLLNELAPLCLAYRADTMFIGTDLCHHHQPAKVMMAQQMAATGFAATRRLRSFIERREPARPRACEKGTPGGRMAPPTVATTQAAPTPSAGCQPPQNQRVPSIAHNSGIFGGRFGGAFMRGIDELVNRTRRHYAGVGGGSTTAGDRRRRSDVVDMLVVNEVALAYASPLERGWPYGRVNMPMWGDTCQRHTFFCRATRGADALQPHAPCGNKEMLVAQQPFFVFTHKVGCGQRLLCR